MDSRMRNELDNYIIGHYGEDQFKDDEFVVCPECGNEQADMGHNVACENCGYAPMPTSD